MKPSRVVFLSALTTIGGAVLFKHINKKVPGFNG